MDRPLNKNRFDTIHATRRHDSSSHAGKARNAHAVPPNTELPQQPKFNDENPDHPIYLGCSYHASAADVNY